VRERAKKDVMHTWMNLGGGEGGVAAGLISKHAPPLTREHPPPPPKAGFFPHNSVQKGVFTGK
jgi:hypothetical protein